jgi:azurin
MAWMLACLALAVAQSAFAAQPDSTAATPNGAASARASKAEPTQKKARPLPFQGKIKTLDKAGGKFTIGERTFVVTSESKVMKRDKTMASLAAVAVGEHVTGSYRKTDDGRLLVNTLYIGPKKENDVSLPTTSTRKENTANPR